MFQPVQLVGGVAGQEVVVRRESEGAQEIGQRCFPAALVALGNAGTNTSWASPLDRGG
ncbi:hypothetical protein [Achromobacter spanius]|uniref:hypothetical protein n=1 Tax=Achromobacter spanius TaxID=217203 RepID=UPI00382F98BC